MQDDEPHALPDPFGDPFGSSSDSDGHYVAPHARDESDHTEDEGLFVPPMLGRGIDFGEASPGRDSLSPMADASSFKTASGLPSAR